MGHRELAHDAHLDRFDRISRLATRLFDVPLAWVVDEHYERLQAFTGDPAAAAQPLPWQLDQALVDADGQLLGHLVVADVRPHRFDADDRELLAQLARTVAAELALTRRHLHDPLTGLYQREGFDQAAAAAAGLCTRIGRPMSLHFFDLDGFKPINDTWGHPEGDRALRDFGTLLRQAFRASDVLARFGGDEFLALTLGDERPATPTGPLARLRALLQRHAQTSGTPYRLDFSVGTALWTPGTVLDLPALQAEADHAMLADKRARKAARR